MFAVTKRLLLRPGWAEDAPTLAAAIGHEAVVRNLARAPWPYSREDAAGFLALPCAPHQPRFLVCERSGAHRLIGGAELMQAEHGWELGYWLTPDAWGRGYATEAGRAVLGIARDTLGLKRLAARHYCDNPASGRVLAKLGFREIGRTRTHSLARGGEVDGIELMLDFAPAAAMALAA
jgi:RimJ/RimL family protein N-acetyltransferase